MNQGGAFDDKLSLWHRHGGSRCRTNLESSLGTSIYSNGAACLVSAAFVC